MPMNIHEAYRTPNRPLSHNNQKTKCTKQRKNVKSSKGKGQVKHKGRPIRTTQNFSPETMKARRSWAHVIQTLRKHKFQPRLLFPAKLSIIIAGKNKMLHDKTKFYTISSHRYGLTKDNRWKTPTQGGTLHPRKKQGSNLSTNLKEDSHRSIILPLDTKITRSNNHVSLISLNTNGLNSPIKDIA